MDVDDRKMIGRVSATEKNPSSSEDFFFWLDDKVQLNAFDIVRVEKQSDKSVTYAIITELYHVTDSPGHISNYVSSDFGDLNAKAMTKRLGVSYAKASVLNNTRENYMPIREGESVLTCNGKDIETALGLDEIAQRSRVPAGIFEASNGVQVPVCFNGDFLIGPEGAHLNVSGISGLATKTSYIMFLLKAIQHQFHEDVAIVVFNVKGDDLLHLDRENDKITDEQVKVWDALNIPCEPFKNVKFYYPYRDYRNSLRYSETALPEPALKCQYESNQAFNYVYTYQHDFSNLEMMFSNIDDPNFTIEAILNYIQSENEFNGLSDWKKFQSLVKDKCESGSSGTKNKEIPVQSWRKFSRLIGNSIKHSVFVNSISGTKTYRQVHLSDEIKNIEGGQVHVVDIAALDEQMQCLVFGDVIRSIYELKHGALDSSERVSQSPIPKKIIIFVDELNKYAPSTSPKNSPLLTNLLEITERGRSEGIILFSAEQFKSAVHDRIKGNCGTHAYGRTNAIELSKPDYRYIPEVYKNMIGRLKKGDLIIQHPVFSSVLKVRFPFPSYEQGGSK